MGFVPLITGLFCNIVQILTLCKTYLCDEAKEKYFILLTVKNAGMKNR